MSRPDMLIDTRTIARIAHVTPAAVSNWRRRHATFPTAAQTSGKSPLYELSEVERWLVEEGRISGRIPTRELLIPMLDVVAYEFDLDGVIDIAITLACYAAVATGSTSQPPGITDALPEDRKWPALSAVEPATRRDLLHDALRRIGDVLSLDLVSLLEHREPVVDETIDHLLAAIVELFADDPSAATELELQLEAYAHERDRHASEHTTPEKLRGLMVDLVAPTGSVIYDPACGAGRLLRAASWHSHDAQPELIGHEITHTTAWRAQLWMLLHDADGDIFEQTGITPTTTPFADTVVSWPPMGMSDWGDADLLLSDSWTLAPVHTTDATTAWVQSVWQALREGGRAVIGLPASANDSNRFGIGELRRNLIDKQLLEAVVTLPDGALVSPSFRACLWVLTADPTDRPPLLIGLPGEPDDTSPPGNRPTAVEILRAWRRDGVVPDAATAWAVPANPDQTDSLAFQRHLPVNHRDVAEIEAELRATLGNDAALLPDPPVTAGEQRGLYNTWQGAEPVDSDAWRQVPVRRIPLTEAAAVTRGVRVTDTLDEPTPTSTVVLQGADVTRGDVPSRHVELHGSDVPRIEPGDILIPVVSSAEPHIRTYVARPGWTGAIPSDGLLLVRPTGPDEQQEWLRLWLQSDIGQAALSATADSSTLAGRIQLRNLDHVEVPLPTDTALLTATLTSYRNAAAQAELLREAATTVQRQAQLLAEFAATSAYTNIPDVTS